MFSVNTAQLVFESSGHVIRMDAYVPESSGHKMPAVIGLHGSGGGYPVVAVPARLLAAHGFAVYIPHYFQRTGTEWVSDRGTILRHAPAWMKTVWDAVSFVSRQSNTDPNRIGLLGFSLGAYLSLGVSVIDDRVKAVVDFFGGFPKEMKLFIRRLCPVLILHGDADETVPVSEAIYLKDLLEKKQVPYELKIYPGEGHGFGPDIMMDAGQRTLAFLQRHLDGTSNAPVT